MTQQTPEQQRATPAGRKDDSGKLDVTLVFDDMPHALEQVSKVLQWAIVDKKPVPYQRGSWLQVENGRHRYRAAQFRHMLAEAKARIAHPSEEPRDWETNLMELSHIATDALFQLEMVCRERLKEGKPL